MLLNDKLKARRIEIGLTMADVAKLVGVSEATVSRWESGDINNMKRDRIALYANALRVSPMFIMGMEEEEPLESNTEILPNDKIRNIPVFESVSAGFGAYACSDIVDYITLYIANDYDAKDTICIKVKGNSMYPKIEDGDMVVVRKQSSVDSGQVAVVLIDGDEGLVKKVVYDKNTIELHSFNPEYQTKVFEGRDVLRVNVVGLVKQVIKNL